MASEFKLVTFGPQQQTQLQVMKETYKTEAAGTIRRAALLPRAIGWW